VRQRINFRLLRIFLVFVYILVTGMVLVYHFNSPAQSGEELVVGEGHAHHGASDLFALVGGLHTDFRRDGFQVSRGSEDSGECETV
jgi:hypothetical protein